MAGNKNKSIALRQTLLLCNINLLEFNNVLFITYQIMVNH